MKPWNQFLLLLQFLGSIICDASTCEGVDVDEVLEEMMSESDSSVMVAVIICNLTPHTLTLQDLDLQCGGTTVNSSFPAVLHPEESSITFTEKVTSSDIDCCCHDLVLVHWCHRCVWRSQVCSGRSQGSLHHCHVESTLRSEPARSVLWSGSYQRC